MCHKTTCRRCAKATWSGCGNHIEQALKGVPKADRCVCVDEPSTGGFFSRLLSR
jgi:hypothetical protein